MINVYTTAVAVAAAAASTPHAHTHHTSGGKKFRVVASSTLPFTRRRSHTNPHRLVDVVFVNGVLCVCECIYTHVR